MAGSRKQRYLIFSIDSDVCFYPEEQKQIQRILVENGIESRHVTVSSDKGHDSFLLDPDKYAGELKAMLDS